MAIGDSDFASNGWLGIPGNRDLFMNAVNWLAQQENMISIRPKDPEDRRSAAARGSEDLWIRMTAVHHSRTDSAGGRPDLVAEAIDARRAVYCFSSSSSPARARCLPVLRRDEAGRRATTREETRKVFSVAADKIDEVTIKSDSGERTTLKKTGTDWQVVSPAENGPSAVDAAEVSGITTNLSTLEQQRVIEENARDLKEFGLAEPRIEVAFKAGGAEQKLQIGSKTPTGGDVYAKVDGAAEGVPDLVVPGIHVQPEALRPP